MKLDLEPPAVRRTAARIIAPDPAQAGRRPLAAALRPLDQLYDRLCGHPYDGLCDHARGGPYDHAHGHPRDHPHPAPAAAHTRTHESEV